MVDRRRMKYATSYSLSIFTPIALVPPPEEERGILIGEDIYRRPVYLNYERLPNFHGIILGPTGSGKSTTVENLMYDLVDNGISYVAIDPGLDYVDTTGELGGVEIDMTRNIPDIFEAPTEIDYWYSMLSSIFAYSLDLDPITRGAVRNIIEMAVNLEHLEERFMEHPDLSGRARSILSYISKPNMVMEEVFAEGRPTVLTYRSGVRRLPPEVEKFLTIFFTIWVREYFMSQPVVHRPRLVFIIDEAWRLLKGVEELNLVDYIREMRKYGVGYWIVTQSVTDMPLEAYEQFGFTLALSGPRIHAMKLDALTRLRKSDIDWLLSRRLPGYAVLIRSGFPKPTQLRVLVREEVLRRRAGKA